MTETATPPPDRRGRAPATPGVVHTTREIEALIPHRWPFLLVDRIVEYDAGGEADRRDQGRDGDRVVLPGPLPGPAGHAGRPPGRGARPDDGGLRREAAGVRRPDRPVRRASTTAASSASSSRATSSGSRSRWRSSARGSARAGPSRRVDGEVACEATLSFIIPPEGVAAMTARLAVLSDVHGNLEALTRGPRRRSRRSARTRSSSPATSSSTAPSPAGVVDALREMEASGAHDRPGQHRHRRRRLRLRGRLPVDDRRRPGHVPRRRRMGPRRARRRAGRLAAPAAVRAPPAASTTRWSSSATPRPGSQTAGLRPGRSTRPSSSSGSPRTDARVICCGHTHLPEVRDLGWKLIVNDGIGGLRLRRRPDRVVGARRRSTATEIRAEIRRAEFDAMAVANAISARGLPGDVYRAATVRTGKLVR